MWKQLLNKWFGLQDETCEACEILREQLAKSDSERKELLARILNPPVSEPPPPIVEEMKPIASQFVPWRVKQQMLETEDAKKAELMRAKALEIEKLEKELGVSQDAS